jgi:hypothetical protein
MEAIVITALVIYCLIGAALWMLSPWWRDKGGEVGTQWWNPLGIIGSAFAAPPPSATCLGWPKKRSRQVWPNTLFGLFLFSQ